MLIKTLPLVTLLILCGCASEPRVAKSTPSHIQVIMPVSEVVNTKGDGALKAAQLADAECAKYNKKKARLIGVWESAMYEYDCQ